MTTPHDNPELFDTHTLNGVRSPGTVTFSGLENRAKVDVKDGDGQDDGFVTHKGRKIRKFKATYHLVRDHVADVDQFAEWDAFLPILKAAQEGDEAAEFFHPDTAELEIGAVTVEAIGGKKRDAKGGATVVVDYIDYRPARAKPVTSPSGARTSPSRGTYDSSGTSGPSVDPNEQARNNLDALLEEARRP